MAALCHVSSPAAGGGTGKSPKDQPVLLCANHSSAVDPILLICAMRQDFPLRIMAKKRPDENSRGGSLLRAIGVFGVDRGNPDIAAVKTSIQSLRDGWNSLVFPEGTRVKEPGGRVDVKGGVGMMAIRSGVPLVPVFIGRDKRLFHRVSIIMESPTTRYTRPEGNGGGVSVQRRGDHASGLCAGRNPMAEVRVAKSAGFCYGVERAVKLAEETARAKGGLPCWAASSTTSMWWRGAGGAGGQTGGLRGGGPPRRRR
ncbi:MAG: 1-acyl-sn-glycerol-3-phosphate acyltransferase [Dysosmobacter sp.]